MQKYQLEVNSLRLIVLCILLVSIVGCVKEPVFNGSRTSNDTQFILEYEVLNDTKTHDMELEEGTIINVVISDNSGRVDILVEDVNGEIAYKGDHASSGNFSFKIPKTETYTFSVTGSKAKGGVSFKVAE